FPHVEVIGRQIFLGDANIGPVQAIRMRQMNVRDLDMSTAAARTRWRRPRPLRFALYWFSIGQFAHLPLVGGRGPLLGLFGGPLAHHFPRGLILPQALVRSLT